MGETYLNADADQIVDHKSFSGLSLIALILAVVSVFSILYVHLLPVAIVAAICGSIVLKIAPSQNLSGLSKFLAVTAIVIATTCGAWGIFRRNLQTRYDLQFAKQIAEQSLEAIHNDERAKVLLLSGVPVEELDTPSKPESMEPNDGVKENYRTSRDYRVIRNRTVKPVWKFDRLEAEFSTGQSYHYKLRYTDVAQTIPASYFVMVRKDCPKEGPMSHPHKKGKKILEPSDYQVRWFLDSVDSVVDISPFDK